MKKELSAIEGTVYDLLSLRGLVTIKDIVRITQLSEWYIRVAVNSLIHKGLVEVREEEILFKK